MFYRITFCFLLLLTIYSCSYEVPGIEYDTDQFITGQRKVKNLTVDTIKLDHGFDVSEAVTQTYWTTTFCPEEFNHRTALVIDGKLYVHYIKSVGYSIPYPATKTVVIWKERCYSGILFDCDEIYVAKRDMVSNSAYAHELGHCYKLYSQQDGDRNHEDDNWWDTITKVKDIGRENNW